MRFVLYKITLLLLMVLVSFWIALLLVISYVVHLLDFVDTVVHASVAEVGQISVLVLVYVLKAIVCLYNIAIGFMRLSAFDFVGILLQFYALFAS